MRCWRIGRKVSRPASTFSAARRRWSRCLNDHLDDLDSHRAKAYMTCRAVQAAKFDFDATDEDHNFDRGEAKRHAEQFFRIEASVGMD